MKQEFTDDTLLARWLSGELTDTELAELESRPDFEDFKRIATLSEQFEVPAFKQKKVWNQLSESIQNKPKAAKVVSLRRQNITYFAAAAVVLLLIGFWFYNDTQVADGDLMAFMTNVGERENYTLPDGSVVHLNPDSKVTYSKQNWANNRTLKLNGSAFFEVKKGSDFTVNVPLGSVQVLGTSFTVNTRYNTLEVACYTGKVKVATTDSENTLTPGQKVQVKQGKMPNLTEFVPTAWHKNTSTFKSTPLYQVLEALERQYTVTIQGLDLADHRLYSGNFPNDDLDIALQKVIEPMGLEIISNDGKIIKLKRQD